MAPKQGADDDIHPTKPRSFSRIRDIKNASRPRDLWSFRSRRFSRVNIDSRQEDRQSCVYWPTGPQPDEHICPKRALSPGCSDLLVRGLGVHHPTNFNGLLMRGRSLPPAADETAVEADVKNREYGAGRQGLE
ncbi:hypothetical protein N7449_004050 [Penicillium cf. viridicatum]|uniref:Uncharacterized protein n=1 Tax=Penicillium cf. viridicatum TaxID=2972119 RepID=A0A9W9MY60_9EURO|nr:hypothetical protein N7449_004050 [Penicillium cf. viridicatum]